MPHGRAQGRSGPGSRYVPRTIKVVFQLAHLGINEVVGQPCKTRSGCATLVGQADSFRPGQSDRSIREVAAKVFGRSF